MTGQQTAIRTAEIFAIPSTPLYKLVAGGEPDLYCARTADDLIDGTESLVGKLPAHDLVLAALHKYALLARNPGLADFVALLDEVISD